MTLNVALSISPSAAACTRQARTLVEWNEGEVQLDQSELVLLGKLRGHSHSSILYRFEALSSGLSGATRAHDGGYGHGRRHALNDKRFR
jgi:hypothetical protein